VSDGRLWLGTRKPMRRELRNCFVESLKLCAGNRFLPKRRLKEKEKKGDSALKKKK
jgi:hypothetical protein